MEFHEDGRCLVTHGGVCLFSLWVFSQIKRFAGVSTLQNTVLMSPNKDETAVHDCHRPGNMVVRMCKAGLVKYMFRICST